jgi:hypothetical protein
MRLRWWGIFVVLLVALAQISCRKTVAPNTDRNRAPETYLTAAPLDSIGGKPLNRAPYRYAVHWSGSDIDGAIAGYYYAVTETLPGAPLPGPKPSQWHFTTKTDSVFIFDIHEGLGTDREHGFYVFAVDNEGKADPTPAFTRFVARDRNLPGIVWGFARAEGTIFVRAPGGGVTTQPFMKNLTDPQDPANATALPRDTIPTGAAAYFGWHGFDRDWASQISGYRYKLLEPDYQKGDSLTKTAAYGTGTGAGANPTPIPVGLNVFRVRSVDEAGGTTFPDSLRRFVVNFDPDTWWAGPDTNDAAIRPALLRDSRGLYLLGDPSGTPPAATPMDPLYKWMGPGRFDVLPADRKPMATFLEQTKIGQEMHWYIRVDSDTVARNAVALYMFAGGSDKDSPYSVLTSNPPPMGNTVATPGPANGSPIGVEYRTVRELITGVPQTPSFTEVYPNFDPLSPSFRPELYFTDPYSPQGGFTGKSFAQVRSVDGNSGRDHRMRNPRDYIYAYNAGDMSQVGLAPGDTVLRRLVINWFSNYNPYFLTNIVGFTPTPDTLLTNPSFTAHLWMYDSDSTSSSPAPFLVRFRFRHDNEAHPPGDDEGWSGAQLLHSGETLTIPIPTDSTTVPPGHNYFEFELSDFPDPEATNLTDRRIVRTRIPFYWLTMTP